MIQSRAKGCGDKRVECGVVGRWRRVRKGGLTLRFHMDREECYRENVERAVDS